MEKEKKRKEKRKEKDMEMEKEKKRILYAGVSFPYWIYPSGEIFNFKGEKIKQNIQKGKAPIVAVVLSCQSKKYNFSVARLVMNAFGEKLLTREMVVVHKDGNFQNNNFENLEIADNSQKYRNFKIKIAFDDFQNLKDKDFVATKISKRLKTFERLMELAGEEIEIEMIFYSVNFTTFLKRRVVKKVEFQDGMFVFYFF